MERAELAFHGMDDSVLLGGGQDGSRLFIGDFELLDNCAE